MATHSTHRRVLIEPHLTPTGLGVHPQEDRNDLEVDSAHLWTLLAADQQLRLACLLVSLGRDLARAAHRPRATEADNENA